MITAYIMYRSHCPAHCRVFISTTPMTSKGTVFVHLYALAALLGQIHSFLFIFRNHYIKKQTKESCLFFPNTRSLTWTPVLSRPGMVKDASGILRQFLSLLVHFSTDWVSIQLECLLFHLLFQIRSRVFYGIMILHSVKVSSGSSKKVWLCAPRSQLPVRWVSVRCHDWTGCTEGNPGKQTDHLLLC